MTAKPFHRLKLLASVETLYSWDVARAVSSGLPVIRPESMPSAEITS